MVTSLRCVWQGSKTGNRKEKFSTQRGNIVKNSAGKTTETLVELGEGKAHHVIIIPLDTADK